MANPSPASIFSEIDARYRRYLSTTFSFRDPTLRTAFAKALETAGSLSQGPFVEGMPVFRTGATLESLCRELLGRSPDQSFLDALDEHEGKRPLYTHQEQAIREAFRGGNVVIATGTGSGKTEAFLFPILLSLYREFLNGRRPKSDAGIRALILYPMNALANDQKERLRAIARRLKEGQCPFSFTFGEYIGATPENEREIDPALAQSLKEAQMYGELVYRQDMRNTPPDILLTNYSMLEYLLIRPKDSQLFDNGAARHWQFIVLDEAHQYTGIRGTEMGMLMRRLKQRLIEGGRRGGFTCIATSATIVGADRNLKDVADFASVLFGEEFTSRQVVLGDRVSISGNPRIELAPFDYLRLRQIVENQPSRTAKSPSKQERGREDQLIRFCAEKGLAHIQPSSENYREILAQILLSDARTLKLIDLIREPVRLADLTKLILPGTITDEDASIAVDNLLWLLNEARDSSGRSLVTLRYHHFIRALEGAYISFYPRLSVSLDRGSTGEGAKFELAICQDCGQHYIVGKIRGGRLEEAVRDPARDDFGVSYFLPLGLKQASEKLPPNGEKGPTEAIDDAETPKPSHILCAVCGRITQLPHVPDCGHAVWLYLSFQKSKNDAPDELAKCAICGRKGKDPVKEVIHGSDGPHSVIATALHSMLPPEKRKVLAFADGRQEAAFFAWYVERSYKQMQARAYLLNAVRRAGGSGHGLSINDLSHLLKIDYEKNAVLGPAATSAQVTRTATTAVLSEILSTRSRICLEGVGLLRWTIQRPPWLTYPHTFCEPPWNLSPSKAWHLATLLFDTARADGAISWPEDPENPISWNDVDTEVTPHWYTSGAPRSRKMQRSWAGRTTRRIKFLARFLQKHRNLSQSEAILEAQTALNKLWVEIREADATAKQDNLLIPGPEGFAFNLAWWRFYPVLESDTVYVCDTCGQVTTVDTFGICMRPRCSGRTRPVKLKDLPEDHYRSLYQSNFPGGFRAEEHTAQLHARKAHEYQKDFKNGSIHLLSSSTTFELGVDLGDLDTVFLRNVPPQPFNYVQRVGRAGRRPGQPGIAITYCRRNPHDLYHFSRYERMLKGILEHPPSTLLKNEKVILRHMAATCLHEFFERHEYRFHSVKGLVGDFSKPSLVEDIRAFIRGRRHHLEIVLKEIVPKQAWDKVGLIRPRSTDEPSLGSSTVDWVDLVCGSESNLARAEQVVCSDWVKLHEFMDERSKNRKFRDAQWAHERLEAIETENVLSFLSRNCVIPKYGFPVDVVPLEIAYQDKTSHFGRAKRRSSDKAAISKYGVDLNRSLSMAIAEYGPGSRIIANKKEWTSCGLKKVAGITWTMKKYRCSERHNFFEAWEMAEREEPRSSLDLEVRTFVVPNFGFVTGRQTPREPKRRPARQYTTRPYFAGAARPDTETLVMPSPQKPLILLKKAFPGNMVELCEGRRRSQFWVCLDCGAGFSGERNYPGEHKDPYGGICNGQLKKVSLAHEFKTDVVEVKFLLPFSGAFTNTSEVGTIAKTQGETLKGRYSGLLHPNIPSVTDGTGRNAISPGTSAKSDADAALWFSYSLAYALLAGTTDCLGVPAQDLNVTVRYCDLRPGDVYPILIYDNVPAGAGLVSRLEDPQFMKSCLESALDRVSGLCGCGYDSSCYGCLRSYRNQFAHDKLQRGPVKQYLHLVLQHWRVD